MKTVKCHDGLIRFFADFEEAFDKDPDGMADMFGYNSEHLQNRILELKSAVREAA